ncbi:MAG TPA: lysylphosphatidylglycerol synthase transmembrane domain-containing protein [Bacteroidales bacterium]|nr:lysylphosphatidylglycerol synthase transmembrane domain-containing protein [Bacteroidales bacterium]
MKKKFIRIFRNILFLAAGVALFYWIYKDMDMQQLKNAAGNLKWGWIIVSLILGTLSNLSRAFRWMMLLAPTGYRVKWYNSFLAVLVLYLVNLIIPRAGELARCSVLTRYEQVPFPKAIGTVVVERITDLVIMLILAAIIFSLNLSTIKEFFLEHPEFGNNIRAVLTFRNLIIGIFAIAVLAVLYLLWARKSGNSLMIKLRKIKDDFIAGMRSISQVSNIWIYLGHSLFIFVMWLLMLYSVFLAYEPTAHLGLRVAMITFLMGGLAMLAPVQGGIGPWHFMVYETLFIFGITKAHGKIFALIAHTSTNLIYLVIGLIALLLLPIVNSGFRKKRVKQVTD